MNENELIRLKSDIEKAKVSVSELTGQKNALLRQLEEWDCKTIEQAEQKLKEMQSEISVIDKKIEEGVKALEAKL